MLALRSAVGRGGEAAGSREAVRAIAGGPFGQVLVGLVVLGLAGYVIWRVVQAILDPEADADDSGLRRLGLRAFYLASAVLYGLLAHFGFELLFESGAGGGGGSRGWMARLMSESGGRWLVGAVGVGIASRGLLQFFKAYTASFRDRIREFDLGPARGRWTIVASRVGLTARGVIFGIIGGYFVIAAVRHDPSEARSLEGALATLRGEPWLLAAIGAGLVCYAVYQWVKARYRLIGV